MDIAPDTPEMKRSVDAQFRRRSWLGRIKDLLGDVESVIALLWLISSIGLASLFFLLAQRLYRMTGLGR